MTRGGDRAVEWSPLVVMSTATVLALVVVALLNFTMLEVNSMFLIVPCSSVLKISFTHSVLNQSVVITGRVCHRFYNLSIGGSDAVVEYYSHGWSMGTASTDTLSFCTMLGVNITINKISLFLKNNCLTIKVVW